MESPFEFTICNVAVPVRQFFQEQMETSPSTNWQRSVGRVPEGDLGQSTADKVLSAEFVSSLPDDISPHGFAVEILDLIDSLPHI